MSSLEQLIHEIHRRSLWQVLGIYLAASWVVYEIIEALTSGLDLPEWFPAFAVVLLLIGLPIVLATAFVQEGVRPGLVHRDDEAAETPGGSQRRKLRRLFTWRNALVGGLLAFALWGMIAAGWLLFGGAQGRAEKEVERNSIAALPFDNMSGDPDDEYFAEGIHDEILTQLSHIDALRVISRTSVMQYRNSPKNLRAIAEELGVNFVLEGSVRRAGDRVRITAQLIDARSDEHLWAETYDRRLTDVFAIQSDVALKIMRELQAELSPSEAERIARPPTQDVEAYDLYLLGRFWWNKRTPEGLRTAIGYFEQAIERDAAFALAYAGLADAFAVLPWHSGSAQPVEDLRRGELAAQRALDLDPDYAEAHASLGYINLLAHRDFDRAEEQLRRATDLNPDYGTAHHWLADLLSYKGQLDDAIASEQRALKVDPLSLIFNANLGLLLRFDRQYEASIAQYRKALELDPQRSGTWFDLALAALLADSTELAARALGRWAQLSGQHWTGWDDLASQVSQHRRTGKSPSIRAEVDTLRGLSPVHRARLFALAGDHSRALQSLERALEERWPQVLEFEIEPAFDALRDDPRFTEIVRQVGLDP